MIGCSVTSSSFSGIWRMCARLRRATSSESSGERAHAATSSECVRVRARLAPVSVRKTSSSVCSRRCTSTASTPAASSARTTSTRRVRPRSGTTTRRASASSVGLAVGERAQRRGGGLDVGGGLDDDLEPLAADHRLQLRGRAVRDGAAVVEHDDVVGERVGLLEVLRRQQHRRPARDELADHVPELAPRARVEAGRRLVEEEHGRVGDEARGEVEPPPHAARVLLHEPVAGVGDAEALEQLAGAARGRRARTGGRAGRSARGSRGR